MPEARRDGDRDRREVLSTVVFVLVRAFPVILAYAAYEVATKNDSKADDRNELLDLTVALLIGIATYIILSEFSLHRIRAALRSTDSQLDRLIAVSGIEIIYDRRETLTKARALHRGAEKRVDAMWALFPYNNDLKHYFAETLQKPELHTSRLIAVSAVSNEDLIDHLVINYDAITKGSYEVFLISECNYEAMVVDNSRAALFIYSSLGYGSAFISSTVADFVQAMQGLITDLQRRATHVVLPQSPTNKFEVVNEFVHNFKQGALHGQNQHG